MSTERQPPVAVLRLRGDIDLSDRWQLETVAEDVWRADTDCLLIDLRECSFLDCSVVGVLWRTCQQAPVGGSCLVVGATGPVRRVLALTGFLDVVEEVSDLRSRPSRRRSVPRARSRRW